MDFIADWFLLLVRTMRLAILIILTGLTISPSPGEAVSTTPSSPRWASILTENLLSSLGGTAVHEEKGAIEVGLTGFKRATYNFINDIMVAPLRIADSRAITIFTVGFASFSWRRGGDTTTGIMLIFRF